MVRGETLPVRSSRLCSTSDSMNDYNVYVTINMLVSLHNQVQEVQFSSRLGYGKLGDG